MQEQIYKIGDPLFDENGTVIGIVGPVSPVTGLVMMIEPLSGALGGNRTWDEAERHAAGLRDKGHANARQPGAAEWAALSEKLIRAGFNMLAAAFDATTYPPVPSYWTGTKSDSDFIDYIDTVSGIGGNRIIGAAIHKNAGAHTRCIWDAPPDFKLG